MKMKLTKLIRPGVAALVAAFLATMPVPAQANDRDQVATDKNGNPVYRYQVQQCGVEYQHKPHWFSTSHSSHDHYCDGTPHIHRDGDNDGSRPRY